tara:strand:+ start:19575 stop:20090 length:516 start_codon:yes stop_codon:yes gene_type:complete
MWLLLGIALLMNTLVGRFISRVRGEGFGGKIRDIGFDFLPDLTKYEVLHDMTMILPLILLIMNWNGVNQKGYITFLTTMYFMRAISNVVTQFPRAKSKPCKEGSPLSNCNDYMFSGHTTFNIVTSYFLNNGMFPVYPILSSLVTVSTRAHYSVDVVIAWIIFFALKLKMKV